MPQRMEEALNSLFTLRPADLYGELVARGGEAAGGKLPPPAPAPPEGQPSLGGVSGAGGGSPRRAGAFLAPLQRGRGTAWRGKAAVWRCPRHPWVLAVPGLPVAPSQVPGVGAGLRTCPRARGGAGCRPQGFGEPRG